MLRALCLLALSLLIASTALAQTYKWLDENGHAQFSDRPPPPGVKFEILNAKGAPPATAPATGPAAKPVQRSSLQEQEIEFRKRRVLAAEKEKEEEKSKAEAG